MRLYGTAGSPFVARVRIQIVAKSLPVEIVEPPGGIGSPQMLALSSLARIPVLETEEAIIPESAVIQEFLEDRFPTPSLRGRTPVESARVRLLSRIVDLYLVPALQPLRALRSGTDAADPEAARNGLDKALGQLDAFLGPGLFAVAEELTLADCAIALLMYYVDRLSSAVIPGFSRTHWRRLEACTPHMASHPAVKQVLALIESAVAAAKVAR